MANVKKQAKNAKPVQQTDPNAEFNAKWDALPLWDKIKAPFILALLFTLTGILLLLFSNAIGYFMFYPATMFFLVTIALYFGIRPSKNSKPPRPDIMHDPMYRHLPGNIYHKPDTIHHSSSSDYHTSPTYSHLPGNIHHSSSSDHHSSSSDYHTSPSYSHLPGNIYHNPWNN